MRFIGRRWMGFFSKFILKSHKIKLSGVFSSKPYVWRVPTDMA
jgi:hypothetical protein